MNTKITNNLFNLLKEQNIQLPICYDCLLVELGDGDICTRAAKNNHLECLKYAHENECPWDQFTCLWAAYHGNLECLKYAHENGCHWNGFTTEYAAMGGHLDCLKYAHENGCPKGPYTMEYAAREGHLDCLKYGYENGFPWDKITCQNAAQKGHLECLKYAHENGCSWDEMTCQYAAQNGQLACLKYAHENGCPWDYNTCEYAAIDGSLECLIYAHENGCPDIERWDRCISLDPFKPNKCLSCCFTKDTKLTKKKIILQRIMMDKLKPFYKFPIDYLNQKAIEVETISFPKIPTFHSLASSQDLNLPELNIYYEDSSDNDEQYNTSDEEFSDDE